MYQNAFSYVSQISAIHRQYFYRLVCIYSYIVEMSYDAVLLVIGRFSLSHNGCSVVAEVDEEGGATGPHLLPCHCQASCC